MSNLNYNRVILGGHVVRDPEIKTTQSGDPMCVFYVAVSRRGNSDKSDFFNVVAFRKLGENIAQYFRRGSGIQIEGQIQNREWVDGNGVKRYATYIIANEVYFVDNKNSQPQDQAPPPAQGSYMADRYATIGRQAQLPPMTDLSGDEELPF